MENISEQKSRIIVEDNQNTVLGAQTVSQASAKASVIKAG